jgi:hypothetical protein
VVDIHLFRIVDDVADNIDRRMMDLHLRKITGAQEICDSLYEGFPPVVASPAASAPADTKAVA